MAYFSLLVCLVWELLDAVLHCGKLMARFFLNCKRVKWRMLSKKYVLLNWWKKLIAIKVQSVFPL